MPKILVLAASLLMASSAIAVEIPIKNAGFEEPMIGIRIPGWSRTQHAGVRAYEIARDSDTFSEGKHSIRMERTTEQAYGLISQHVTMPDLGGQMIEFSASLKTREVGELGWIMVMTFKQHSGILSQVRSEPVTGDTDWTEVVLKAQAPAATTTIDFGFMLSDGGTGWADNARLRLVQADGAKSEPAKADATKPEAAKPAKTPPTKAKPAKHAPANVTK